MICSTYLLMKDANCLPTVDDNPVLQMCTHVGFLTAYNSVRDTVHALIKHIISSPGEDREQHPWRALVTGHSLGGALANLAAYDLSLRKWEHEKNGGGCE